MYGTERRLSDSEVPELQSAGGWEEAVVSCRTCCVLDPLLLGTIDKKPRAPSHRQAITTFSPRYKQHGYLLHTALLFVYQKSIVKKY